MLHPRDVSSPPTEPPLTALPAVLRLPPHRSVLRLGPRSRLVGLDPAVAVAVEDLPSALAEMLDELTRPVPTAELVGRVVERGGSATDAEALLRELVTAGAVVDAAGPQRCIRVRAASCVVVRGNGPIAVGVVLGLAAAGVGALHVETHGPVLEADLGTGLVDADLGQDRRAAVAAALGRLCPQATAGAPRQGIVPDLVVLADSVPEPAQIVALHETGTAHLPAWLRDGTGVVGPLVLPGRTACLGCLELHRRARDPSWPAVAARLAGRRGAADPACSTATAGLATAQALAALDATAAGAGPPATLEATLELDLTAGEIVRRTWRPRPECSCRATTDHPGVGRATGW
jgi:bacteriocin biosynthesis cyclodehydratase domain-containing protein